MELGKAGSTDEDGKRESDAVVAESYDDAGPVAPMSRPTCGKKRKRKGGGCLLWVDVILILYILGWVLIPPFIVKSLYYAEKIPVIGNLRTMVGLYYFEQNRFPGLGINSNETVGATSQLAENLSRVQTFRGREQAAWTSDFR